MTGGGRLCTFEVGGLRLALPVGDVTEVVRGERVVGVPLAPGAVIGLLNLRGRIVPVVDARLRLSLPARVSAAEATHVVLELGGELLSLVVDRMGDVVDVVAADRQDVPETVEPEIRRLCTAAYQREDALLLVLDPRLVLAVP